MEVRTPELSSETIHASCQWRSTRLTNAIAANATYVRNPQKAVGSPSGVAHWLLSTMSQALPTSKPLTDRLLKAVQDR